MELQGAGGYVGASALRSRFLHSSGLAGLIAVGVVAAVPVGQAQEGLPTGGIVTFGQAAISRPSTTGLLVTQTTPTAIIDWQSFSVGGGATAHFDNGAGATLNRVRSNDPSLIQGSLTATGSLYLVNPAGVAVGPSGRVSTGGSFIASTHDVSDADFIGRGAMTFSGSSKAGIVNHGTIRSAMGDVALIARRVENAGEIAAPRGTAGLLAGYEVLMRHASGEDGKFAVRIGGPDTEVVNSGTIKAAEAELRANGGNVYALGINTRGTIKATGVRKQGGRIFLTAPGGKVEAGGTVRAERRTQPRSTPRQSQTSAARDGGQIFVNADAIRLSGQIDASGTNGGRGGNIVATARTVEVAGTARLDVSGSHGGLALLGGDFQGGADPERNYWSAPLATAETLLVEAGAEIRADGTAGAGGNVVVWSDGHTNFAGAISATGVTAGGDAEVSGKALLDYAGTADLRASEGDWGTLLLDPYNLTISNDPSSGISGGFDANANDSILNVTTLKNALASANVTVTTGLAGSAGGQAGNITVAAPVSWTTGSTLTLQAAGNIAINVGISAPSGGLALQAGTGSTITTSAAGTIDVGTFSLLSGNWRQEGALPAFHAGDFRLEGGSFLRVTGGDGSAATPYLVGDVYGLQGIGSSTSLIASHWALANDIDASGTSGWNDGHGFMPVGTYANRFAGSFDGQDHVISGLVIDRSSTDFVGLFGAAQNATIQNVGLENADVKGGYLVGALVGYADSSNISQAYATGTVSGANDVGGLVGNQTGGSISHAYATGKVAGANFVGGLVGYQEDGSIEQAYATGTVSGTNDVGGLVGYQANGSITQAYATGAVTGADFVGGLVGYQVGGTITQAYATGAVTGTNYVGGLVGRQASGSVNQSYATGTVSGTNSVGGLVGYQNGGSVATSFWDTTTTGQSQGSGGSAGGGTFSAVGLNTADLMKASTYSDAGWSISAAAQTTTLPSANWLILDGETRPFGAWEHSTTITNAHQLQLMAFDLDANYTLASDIDLGAALTQPGGMWSGRGFLPVGTLVNRFAGSFDGQGHVISGLAIDRSSTDYVGLLGFAQNTTIQNVGLENADVKGRSAVGALVGYAYSSNISHAYAAGTVSGANYVGGLVGFQQVGTISQAYATGAVTGIYYVGGLVGYQEFGTITHAYAAGDVTGANYVGGLVGLQDNGSISQAYATGAVISTGNFVGGLVGYLVDGSITRAYATGSVTGASYVGGLVGSQTGGSISQAYATGTVSGNDSVGGLVGWQDGGNISQAYATGTVSGTLSVGGLVGYQDKGSISQAYATGAVSGGFLRGLVGYQEDGSTTASFFDADKAGAGGRGGGSGTFEATGLTTEAFQDTTGFMALAASQGWDFETMWAPPSDGYYPELYALSRVIRVDAGQYMREYGEANPTIAAGNLYGGPGSYVFGPAGDAISQPIQLSPAADVNSGVGTYAVLGSATSNGGIEYRIVSTGSLEITPATLTVVADARSKVYGDADPTLTYTVTGFKLTDTAAGVLTGSLTRDAGENVAASPYAIGQGSLAANANYTIAFTGADFTITPATLTVVADARSKVYGDADPTLTYTVTGFKLTDTAAGVLTGSLTRDAGETVAASPYAIGQGSLAANANYTIAFTGADFTITPATLTVVADARSKVYGDADPTLTYTVTGFRLADTAAGVLTGSLTRDAGEGVGAYLIRIGSLTGGPNYAIDFTGATFSIKPAIADWFLERPPVWTSLWLDTGVSEDGEDATDDETCVAGVLGAECQYLPHPNNRRFGLLSFRPNGG